MSIETARILVVDDNPATLYSTSHVLRSVGWTVVEAGMGQVAVERSQNVDLVVLDVNLPDMDGFEVCRKIRAREQTARIPVIHLSATFVGDRDKVHGFEAGADGYLTHPIEPPVLIATVRAFLRTREAEAAMEQLLLRERAARTEAEEANRVKDEFLAVLSHEMRTPLNAIVGWAQVLKLLPQSNDDVTKGIDAIERNAKAQAQMIGDLLDISRIISGKLRLDIQNVDLAHVIEAAIIAIQPAADAKQIQISKTSNFSTVPMKGDAARLQQVIWNLVNNAVKFTPKGGTVQVSLERTDSHVELSVSDNGKGISPHLLPYVFERFRQGDSSSSRESGGLGLGLSLAKQFIELHGGTIGAESEGEGKGARFTVRLPIAPPSPGPKSSRDKAVSADKESLSLRLDGIRVLLVDDEADARLFVKRLLENTGAEVFEANGMEKGLETLERTSPHILISDIGMPQHDGLEFIRAVRDRGYKHHQLPAIALTAFARHDDRHRILLSGYQMHIVKPVDLAELVAAVATLVGRTSGT